MLRLASLIVRNVMRNRRRTLLTLGSTAVSLALLTLMVAMYQSFFYGEDNSPAESRRIISRHRVSLTQPLPASYMGRIKGVEGVEKVSAWSWFGGKYIDERHFFARFAVDADTIFDIHPDWEIAADQRSAFRKDPAACVVGEKIARSFDIKLGQTLHIQGDIYPVDLELKVVGIFKHPRNTEVLAFHREYLTELLPKTSESRDMVGTYIILAHSPAEVPRISRAIDTMFDNSPHPTRTESEKEFGRSFLAFLGNIKLFLAAICAAVTFTILLVSANTVAMAVRERTREMAILRTLGYIPEEILQLVIGESVLISLMGGLIGLGLGYLLCRGAMETGFFAFQGLKWQAALFVVGAAVFVGVVASLPPAMFASRKNIVESLRFTG